MHFIDVKYWLQGRGEKRDVAKGWMVKERQYQAMGNDYNIWDLKVNF